MFHSIPFYWFDCWRFYHCNFRVLIQLSAFFLFRFELTVKWFSTFYREQNYRTRVLLPLQFHANCMDEIDMKSKSIRILAQFWGVSICTLAHFKQLHVYCRYNFRYLLRFLCSAILRIASFGRLMKIAAKCASSFVEKRYFENWKSKRNAHLMIWFGRALHNFFLRFYFYCVYVLNGNGQHSILL